MTLTKDLVRIKKDNGEYIDCHILKIESGKLFEPSKYNLKLNSSYYGDICVHEGYCGLYELSQSSFILKNIYANQDSNNHIKIKNVYATSNSPSPRNQGPYQTLFNTIYRGVNIDFSNFTGTIILGKLERKESIPVITILEDEIDDWRKKYKKIIELTYKNKNIVEVTIL